MYHIPLLVLNKQKILHNKLWLSKTLSLLSLINKIKRKQNVTMFHLKHKKSYFFFMFHFIYIVIKP